MESFLDNARKFKSDREIYTQKYNEIVNLKKEEKKKLEEEKKIKCVVLFH